MSVRRRSILDEDEATIIDLAPMIDCVFILLIFFIVTTRFVDEQGLGVAKPDTAAPVTLEESDNVVLVISADNKVWFEDREIAVADVVARVRSGLSDPDTPVVIRAHEDSDHGLFVSVWDAARQAGAETLTFTTVN